MVYFTQQKPEQLLQLNSVSYSGSHSSCAASFRLYFFHHILKAQCQVFVYTSQIIIQDQICRLDSIANRPYSIGDYFRIIDSSVYKVCISSDNKKSSMIIKKFTPPGSGALSHMSASLHWRAAASVLKNHMQESTSLPFSSFTHSCASLQSEEHTPL